MPKPFLSILDPLQTLNAKTDTSLALIQESCARGIINFACELKDIFVKDGSVHFVAGQVELKAGYQNPPHFKSDKSIFKAEEFSVIFMRKDPPVDQAFTAALFMLRCHDSSKVKIINSPDGILLANEKLLGQTVASQFFPPTVVASNKKILLDFIDAHERIVLKPLFSSGGSGVLVFEKNDRNIMAALEILTQDFSLPIKAQAYIKNARLGDKRVIIVGGKAVGAILRVPSGDEHRANFHAGGKAFAAKIEERDLEVVEALRPFLLDLGLYFVGIDIIGGFLTEINVTSPTCVMEIETLSQKPQDKPLRAQIIDYIESLIA